MLAHDRAPRYGAYLLRYWQVRSDRPGRPDTWRFSLERAGTDERRGFPNLCALLVYLERELGCEDAGAGSVLGASATAVSTGAACAGAKKKE